LQQNYIHQAVDRFRHDSKVFKIIMHALFKTFAVFTFSASASYMLIFFLASIIAIFFVFAAIRRVSSRRFFPHLWDVSTFTKCSCKLLALVICFSLPIFIQQGDIDSRSNLDPLLADDGCIFFNSLFNRTNSLDANRGDLFCDSTFWSGHLRMYFNGTYPSVLYRCPVRVSRSIVYVPRKHALQQHGVTLKCRYTLPVLALINLIGSFYTDDFALKNRRVLQYERETSWQRRCRERCLQVLARHFEHAQEHQALVRFSRRQAASFPAVAPEHVGRRTSRYHRAFHSAGPQSLLQSPMPRAPSFRQRRRRVSVCIQHLFSWAVHIWVYCALLSRDHRCGPPVRQRPLPLQCNRCRTCNSARRYHAHYLDGSRLLKALFKPKKLEHSADAFTAKSFLEWEQAYSVLNYCRSGLNVICAFQTTSLSVVFVVCVAGVVSIVLQGISGSCTEAVTIIILSLASASFLLPILFFAFMASRFDITAAYALNDLASQCRSLRERRDLTCFVWHQTECDQLKQRLDEWAQEQQPDSRSRRSLTINAVYDNMTSGRRDGNMASGRSGLNLLVSQDMFDKTVEKMKGALTPVRARTHVVLLGAFDVVLD
jgi:hypothetical protein